MIKEIPETSMADTSYFHGAAVMLPKEVIDECGLMPEDYFLYYEELHWSKIVRDHGYQLKVCTEVSVLHKESVTTGKDSPLKTYYQTRNRVVFMNQHAEPAQRLVFNLFFHGISLPVKIVKHAVKGRMAHISALLRGSYHASIQKKNGHELLAHKTHNIMEAIFWTSTLIILYTFIGYGIVITILAALKKKEGSSQSV